MPIWGPIVAAFIAAFFGAIGLIINKENKISEFRQTWINEFRDEIAMLIESYKMYLAAFQDLDSKDPEVRKLKFEKSGEMHRFRSKIKLRLNANLEKRTDAEEKLDSLMYDIVANPNKKLSVDIIGEIYEQTAIIFKREWEVVKRGERIYVSAINAFKWLGGITGFILILSILFHFEDILIWIMNCPPKLTID